MENIWMFLQQTAAASLTALFLLVLQRIFLDKLSPRWQYGVWFVLLLRLLLPVGFLGRQTALDVSPWVETLRAWAELGLHSAYSSPFVSALPAAPVPLPPEGAPASWTDVLFLVYLAGVLLSALWFVLCAARLSRRVGEGVPVEGDRRAQIEALAAKYRLPCPARIVECRGDHSPFVLGALRPTLVLPMGWAVDGKVVLHELLHLKYRDVWAGWLTTLFRCLHWCNPFLWFIFDKIGSDRESLCDQRVLERLSGEDRRDYGRVLLAMADDRAVRTPGATTMANGARAVKARIEAIARFKRFPQGMVHTSVAVELYTQRYRCLLLFRNKKICRHVVCDFSRHQIDPSDIRFFETRIPNTRHRTDAQSTAHVRASVALRRKIHVRIYDIALHSTFRRSGTEHLLRRSITFELQCHFKSRLPEHQPHQPGPGERPSQKMRSQRRRLMNQPCIFCHLRGNRHIYTERSAFIYSCNCFVYFH